MNSRSCRAVADPAKVIWIRPERIKFKLAGTRAFQMGLMGVVPGDWDFQRELIEETPKYRSIVRHFVEGADWEETELFAVYAERLSRGEPVRGCTSMAEVKEAYDARITQLFESLKTDGFQLEKARVAALPYVYIARDGEILFGREGNHRFAIARILGSEFMPCIVRARHKDWQDTRDRVHNAGPRDTERLPGRELAGHPDLADVISSDQPGVSSGGSSSLWQRFRKFAGRGGGIPRK